MPENGYEIRPEEPPIPMNKKGYIYNNGLIYLGTPFSKEDLMGHKYDACIYRYRKNKHNKGHLIVKYRKINGMLRGRKLFGNLYIQSKSKTGVRSVFTNIAKVRYKFGEEQLSMVRV